MTVPYICLFNWVISIEEILATFLSQSFSFFNVRQKLEKLLKLIFCPDWKKYLLNSCEVILLYILTNKYYFPFLAVLSWCQSWLWVVHLIFAVFQVLEFLTLHSGWRYETLAMIIVYHGTVMLWIFHARSSVNIHCWYVFVLYVLSESSVGQLYKNRKDFYLDCTFDTWNFKNIISDQRSFFAKIENLWTNEEHDTKTRYLLSEISGLFSPQYACKISKYSNGPFWNKKSFEKSSLLFKRSCSAWKLSENMTLSISELYHRFC